MQSVPVAKLLQLGAAGLPPTVPSSTTSLPGSAVFPSAVTRTKRPVLGPW